MANERWDALSARGIVGRIVVEGDLIALTPIHLGNGDSDGLVDLPLLRDPLDGAPLLPGTTIAGALRGYLTARQYGDRREPTARSTDDWATRLFGSARGNDDGEQSATIVDESRASRSPAEGRDGVKLDGATRTAEKDKKFDLELWPAGLVFPLRFELALTGDPAGDTLLRQALATALTGLADAPGGIRLGARKHRGYGQIAVPQWRVTTYDLTTPRGILAWLARADPVGGSQYVGMMTSGADLAGLLGVTLLPDRRSAFEIEATLAIDGSILIRSATGEGGAGPDVVHLQARQADGTRQPILSGTSLAGALRARATRIANTLATEPARARALVDDIFGPEHDGAAATPSASRLTVDEQTITQARTDLVQSRVQIDRFTGGASPGALFSEQPVFGRPESSVRVRVRLVNPADHDVGLLALMLKDLWTGDLPLGGEIGIGRGRLCGGEATLRWQVGADTVEEWRIVAHGQRLAITGAAASLESTVQALVQHLSPEGA